MVLGASPLWLALLPQSSQAQDVDLLSGLEPPISEIVKWAQTSKLKVVACTAIYQEAIDLRQAVLFNFAADGSTDIMSEPTLELLEAFHLYLATFAKNDGTRPRFVTVMFRDGGDYMSDLSYDQAGFLSEADLRKIPMERLKNEAARLIPPGG
jgi:hypothetical protein